MANLDDHEHISGLDSSVTDYEAMLKSIGEQLQAVEKASQAGPGIRAAAQKLVGEIRIEEQQLAATDGPLVPLELADRTGLNIGCGKAAAGGFVNLDLIDGPGVDVVWDIRRGLPFSSARFDVVFSEHVLEHLDYPDSVRTYFSEARRVLKPGGQLIVGVPDAEWAIDAYVRRDHELLDEIRDRWYGRRQNLPYYDAPIDVVNLVFGDERNSDRYTPHLWGYDEEKLQLLMAQFGFEGASRWKPDMHIINPERLWGTLYVSASRPLERYTSKGLD